MGDCKLVNSIRWSVFLASYTEEHTSMTTPDGMEYSMGQFTPAQLRTMAENDPRVTVMEHTWDRSYEPYAASRVEAIVSRLKSITMASSSAEAARKEANEDEELCTFGQRYKLLFEKMTTPEFVADPRAIQAVLSLIDIRQRVESGRLSARTAEEHAAGIAIRKALEDDEARKSDDSQSRIEEVD